MTQHGPDPLPPEPCFRDPPHGGFVWPDPDPQLADWLARRICRRRGDLLGHVQRIHWQLQHGDPVGRFGALADLFIALGRGGLPLRRRLLELAADRLEPNCAAFLRAHLDSGLGAATPLPCPQASRLTGDCGGRLDVVERLTTRTVAAADPLDEARERIDAGQLDQAQTLLEQALLAQPEREELHRELLTVYRHRRDPARLAVMQTRLARLSNPLAAEWAALGRQLADSTDSAAAP